MYLGDLIWVTFYTENIKISNDEKETNSRLYLQGSFAKMGKKNLFSQVDKAASSC